MVIVIEGPDNAGKTTLATKLAKQLRAVYLKAERPSRGTDLGVFDSIIWISQLYSEGFVITDRHPAISEPIYGNIIRGGHDLSNQSIATSLKRIDLVIYCRPGGDAVIKSIQDREHMEGVTENVQEIVQAYDQYFFHNSTQVLPSLMVYDYLRDQLDPFVDVINRIHLKKERKWT